MNSDLMKRVVVAAVLLASPTYALPPLPPKHDEVVESYVRALKGTDLTAYMAPFAADAIVVRDGTIFTGKAAWRAAVERSFTSANRRTQVVSLHATDQMRDVERFMILEEETDCPPTLVECFPITRTETLSVRDGQIVRLERSADYGVGRTPDEPYFHVSNRKVPRAP